MNIDVNVFDSRDMQIATHELEQYLADLQERANRVCERLASIGAVRASLGFSRAIYQGVNDVEVTVEPIQNGYRVKASGDAVLFIEFGAGATYGYGHPDPQGNVPGSYPGKGHWDDPNGWWFPNAAVSAQGGTADAYTHTYGNPPSAAMYEAQQECVRNIERVVNEVFNT